MRDFSDMMKARADITKKINVMVRKVEGITTFLLTGEDEHTPGEVYYVVASAERDAHDKIIADLNFLIREFLRPSEGHKSEEEGRVVIRYLFDDGMKAQVTLCTESDLPACAWWVPYLDKNGAAERSCSAETKKPSDPTCEKREEPAEEPLPEPVAAEPVSAPVFGPEPEQKPAPERSERELWNYFYGKVNNAKHAIDGGAVIYACEIIGELRSLLIKMICEANGITDDYLHCIDLLPENHRNAILRTYPAKPEKANMITALAAELRIFENLMKRSAR
jgi:hypothetical protein